MAANIKDPEERKRRIEQVGNFFEKTGLPTRQVAEYFTENHFSISNKTVHQYIQKYMELYPEKKQGMDSRINENKEESIEDKMVKIRIFQAAKLSLQGNTMQEIAVLLKTTPKTIERDLFTRLKRLASQDPNIYKIYEMVLIKMNQHKMNALNENRNLKR